MSFAADITVIGILGMTAALVVILLLLELLKRLGPRHLAVAKPPEMEMQAPESAEPKPSDEELVATAAVALMVYQYEEKIQG